MLKCLPHRAYPLFFYFLFLCGMPALVFSQQVTVSGIVTDQAKNEPLASVSVELKGTSQGTVTDANGRYTLRVPNLQGILVFSSVGYTNLEVPMRNQSVVNALLTSSSSSLNEIVVVGYGTQKRKDITGSVVTVDKQRLENLPNTNFAQALQGSVPGISVNMTNAGAEGNSTSILIRGQKSITANTDPLIILDGIPYNGSISDINPSDIASIDVLKDASAAAIYGSRGSNGVILLTTKRGSNGKPVISYDGFYGVEKISNLPTMLTPEQFYQFKITREPNSLTSSEKAVYASKVFPDWVDLATQNGSRTQHTIGVRGGANNVKYYASITGLDVKGVAVNDKFKRLSTRANLEITITNWLTYGTNTQLSYNDRSGLAAYFDGDYGAYTLNPLTKAYDSLGKLTITPWPDDIHFSNPLSPTLANNDDKTYKIFTTNYFQVKIPYVKGLSYRLNTGIEYTARNQSTYWGRNTLIGQQSQGDLILNNSTEKDYTIENILSYDRTFKKHTIGFTGLYSYEKGNFTSNGLEAKTFPNDVLTYYQANVALSIVPVANYSKRTLISQMARINYSYNDRYLLTITGRRDGSSVFGIDNKFSFFPSAALGWNISNENFMANSKTISHLKLRLSYGSNGNQGIDPYKTLAKLSQRSYVDGSSTAPGYVPTSLADPGLHWETTNSANIGFDFGFWNDRLQGTLDVYDTRTHDLLLDRQISSVQGVSVITENIGKTGNKGVELGLSSKNIQGKNLTWTTDANISFNRNRIIDLYGDGKSDTANKWFIGKPIVVDFGYVYNGVWQLTDDTLKSAQPGVHPGYAKVLDLNGNGKIDGGDRTIIGNQEPKFTWGMGNTVKYKNFTLYVFVQGVQGQHRQNLILVDNVNSGVRYNTTLKNWWTPTNPTNDFYANALNVNIYNTHIVENSSYLRVKDLSLSYDISPRLLDKFKLSRLRIYFDTRNPFTITKWSGLDPELNNQQAIPMQKEYLVGINVSL